MKTQYYTAATLDGFIADENHSLDWLFQFGGGPGEDYTGFIANIGACAMGANTYEWVLKHLSGAPSEPWPYTQPCWVFTHRNLPGISGADVRFVHGNVAPIHAEMSAVAAGKNVWVMGGGDLVGQFADAGLLDEMIVTMAPVTLGAGKPLLPRRIVTPPLELISVKDYGHSFVQMIYALPKKGA
jgi:dihydrofolate reductase